jgi:DNA-binding NtrC family response regulator
MPGRDGLSFLRELKGARPEQAVIVMTAYGTVQTAVEAMKLGAFDYLQKPFSTEELLLKLDKLLQYQQLTMENRSLRQRLDRGDEVQLVGQSEAIRRVLARIHALADNDSTVLIQGESGTGKELAARLIHQTSFRFSAPFVPVSCAALPGELIESELFGHEEGAFTGATRQRIGRVETAHGGTLFLDDVDDIPLAVQVKLLRMLQEHAIERVGGGPRIAVSIRVIGATKSLLPAMVKAGQFREDLYYRLNVVPLHMPPLRERLEDIPVLVDHLLEKVAVKLNRGHLSVSAGVIERLQRYHWPGNVRELEHLLERMVVLARGSALTEEDLPPLGASRGEEALLRLSLERADSINMPELLARAEADMVRWALQRADGNIARAAERLGVPRSTLQYKLGKAASQGRSSSSHASAGDLPSSRR